jgi:tetratricopeptide (TPR) repeat protein
MALVLEATHTETGAQRALKLMLPSARNEEIQLRFLQEFRALSRLDHPNILQVEDSGSWHERPYFVMEILQGRELKEDVEKWQRLAPAERFRRADAVMVQLARALAYIHNQGLVHRDVTPSNIMILEDGTAKLMDFGVVKEPGGDLTTVGEVVGTIAYISPEQISGGDIDARADLYSLGAVYYLMLTGRRPFNARTLAGYMDKHLNRPVRPPRELAPTLSERADRICTRLLAKKPDERFASANHLLHLLHANLPETDANRLRNPALVGRTAEAARFRFMLARLQNSSKPGGDAYLIEAEPGMGRSRICTELARLAQEMGLLVSHVSNQQPDQRAFEGFRRVYEDLLESRPGFEAPALQSIFGQGASMERVERWAVMGAMAEMLDDSRPRVLILEDIDQADRGTLTLTEYIIRHLVAREQDRRVLIVLSRQLPENPSIDPIARLVSGEESGFPLKRILLAPLSSSAVEEMLLTVVEDGPGTLELAARLHQEGDGNPFFIGEMIRGLVDDGVIEMNEGHRGRITASPESIPVLPLPLPTTLREFVRERLDLQSEAAQSVCLGLAIGREELDLDLLVAATDLDESLVIQALQDLLDAGLVRERQVGSTERFELNQRRILDIVLERTPQSTQIATHLRIGAHLEIVFRGRTDSVVEALAHHFDEGEAWAKAYAYLLRAAQKSTRRTFVDEALRYLDRALEIESLARHHLTLEEADLRQGLLRLNRASAFHHLGHWVEAREEALEALRIAELVGDDRLMLRTEVELALQARGTGDLDCAEQHLQRALSITARVDDKRLRIVPRYEFGAIQWTRGDLDSARLHFVQALADAESLKDERSRALGQNGLGLIALCKGKSAEARKFFSDAIQVAERHGLMGRYVVSATNLVEIYHLTGNLRKGMELADKVVASARGAHHIYGTAMGLRYRALMLVDMGMVAEARENAEESLRIQLELGNEEEALTARVSLIRALLAANEIEAAQPVLDATIAMLDSYDSEGYGRVVHVWQALVYALQGRTKEAEEGLAKALELTGRKWPHQQVRVLLNSARTQKLLGHPAEAVALAEEALELADSSGFRYYAMRARQILIDNLDDPEKQARHLRVARSLARSLSANLTRKDAASFLLRQSLPDPKNS